MYKSTITALSLLMATILLPLISYASSLNDSVPTRISIITCHAGSNVYELCGHTALRVQTQNSDNAVNYGLFDFDAPNFVYRFVKGETDYVVGAYPFSMFMHSYTGENRRIVEQELNLTEEQAKRVIELLEENLRPENRVYRYNYVKNNCATLPIEIIEQAINDTISFSEPIINGVEFKTFRDEMRYFYRNYSWTLFGIDFALGSGLDYKLSRREKMFAPEALEKMLQGATIKDSNGNSIPIVLTTTILNEGSPNGGVQLPPTPWYETPLFISILILVVIIIYTIKDIISSKVTRWIDFSLFTIMGLIGTLLTFLIFISVHEATSPNYLYIVFNPLCFIVSITIWLKKCKCLLKCYHFINFVVLIALIATWHWLSQSANIAIFPIILCSLIRSINYCYINKCAEKKTA